MDNANVRQNLTGVNLPLAERIGLGVFAGVVSALATREFVRRSPAGWFWAGLGALTGLRAATGRCPATRVLARARRGVRASRTITILRPRSEVYRFWRDLDNLPRFLAHVTKVEPAGDRVSLWMFTQGPVSLSWGAQIVQDIPDRRISWRSKPGSEVDQEGSVSFSNSGDGTRVRVVLRYRPPRGAAVSAAVGRLLEMITVQQLTADLIRLRQLLEKGEKPRREPRLRVVSFGDD